MTYEEQPGLFDGAQPDPFDEALGQALKAEGIERAATAREDVLALGRELVRKAALRRPERTATADDAAFGFHVHGLPEDALGNAAGSLFRGKEWEFTGAWSPSKRTSNHGHQNRVWRLVARVSP